MITLITGLPGSGKSWLMTRFIHRDWKSGSKVMINYPIQFGENNDDVQRWHELDETYHMINGVIGIDEGNKLFDARRWASLPQSFVDKIRQHRHHFLDIYTTSQDINDIDVNIRKNVQEWYVCQRLIRIPKNDRIYPYFQIIRVQKKTRMMSTDSDRILWLRIGRPKFYFLSKYWTKELYNTFADVGLERFICRIKYEKKAWRIKIYSRELINRGKSRL